MVSMAFFSHLSNQEVEIEHLTTSDVKDVGDTDEPVRLSVLLPCLQPSRTKNPLLHLWGLFLV